MSKIEVDQITQQSGTTITVGGGACKTAVVDATTVTLGRCGGSVALASGASQTGFGRTGTVDWQTSIKTSTFTAANGEGYFVNTTGGAVTVNLPAGSAGAIVSIKDYAQTFDTNNCTISADGSEKIENLTSDLVLNTEGIAVTLIYADATRGWQAVNSNEITNTAKYVTATGGTESTCGDFKIHTFTGPGTFAVSCGGNAGGSNSVEYLVVAGGGGGATWTNGPGAGAGGGAGGFRFASPSLAPATYPAKPLAAPANLPVSATNYPITIGAGGAGQSSVPTGASGANSVFSTITSAGGGRAKNVSGDVDGFNGGSGGGKSGTDNAGCAGAGNTPPVSPPQGNPGGTDPGSGGSPLYGVGGGGGAIAAGANVNPHNQPGGAGGDGGGLPTAFGSNGVPCGSFRYYAGGGGGGVYGTPGTGGAGGKGGGGAGNRAANATNGTANTGGGGGGTGDGSPLCYSGGTGGSGIVVIRYKFQN
mgnify:CR=1 FL=1|jgi:hypothetical protein